MIATVETVPKKNPLPRFGEFKMLPVSDLRTDGTYQRPLSPWRVRHIVTNYEPILFQPLIIGLRKTLYYVIDGQHRREGAVELKFKEVPCMVYVTTSAAQEAKAFLWLQKYRRAITGPQQFVAKIAYGDQTASAISAMLKNHGFEIDRYDGFAMGYNQNNVIKSITLLERAYNKGGAKLVDNILYVLRHAWDGRAAALDKRIIRGLTLYMSQNAYGVKAMASKLGELSPVDLISAAWTLGHQYGYRENEAMAAVIGNVYRDAALRARPQS
jgi:hypothetical protein